MNNTVWAVWIGSQDSELDGLFSTKEKALAHCKEVWDTDNEDRLRTRYYVWLNEEQIDPEP